jgi:hypothetical protein
VSIRTTDAATGAADDAAPATEAATPGAEPPARADGGRREAANDTAAPPDRTAASAPVDGTAPRQAQGRETVAPDDLGPVSSTPGGDSLLLTPSPADHWHPDDSPPLAPTPSFLRDAERAARWRQPRMRLALAMAALGLLALLAGQAGLAYRDLLAARWPALRAPLQQACALIGCTVEPPRHIAALSVESSSLLQVGNDSVYALQVAVRNRSELALLPPALELVLTDTQGRTVARRVLSLAELGQPLRTLPPGGEVTAEAMLATGSQRVAGYTIEIFYP